MVQDVDVQAKHQQTVADYVGDMIARESHIEEALDRQLNETTYDPEAHATVQRSHDMVKQHRDTPKALQAEVGSTAGSPITAAGWTLLGKAAGVVNLVRTEGISKAIRDDYAAFSLAAISDSMLHTAAPALTRRSVLGHTAALAALGLGGCGQEAAPQESTPQGVSLTGARPSGDPLAAWTPGQTATINGAALSYEEHGNPAGQPVLLLHGGLVSAESWANLAHVLVAAGYRVIAMDCRGHGRSA